MIKNEPTSGAEPLFEFRRAGESKLLGLLVYIAVVPFLALTIGILGGLFLYMILKSMGVAEKIASLSIAVLLPLSFIGLVLFAIKDFKRRAFAEVAIYSDRLFVANASAKSDVLFADITAVQFFRDGRDLGCEVRLASGQRVRFPADVASFSTVREVCDATFIARLRAQADDSLKQGVVLEWIAAPAPRHTLAGVLLIVWACVLALSIRFYLFAPKTYRLGKLYYRSGRSKGFRIRDDGLIDLENPAECVPWSALELKLDLEEGVLIKATNGAVFTASALSPNAWPLWNLIKDRIDQSAA